METRELGRSGLHVSALGLGGMGKSFSYAGFDIDPAIGETHGALTSRPERIRAAVEGSLTLVRVDRVRS